MAKSTKIIAALGVAAGLGVAAMPLATFAAAGIPGEKNNVVDTINIEVDETCTISAEDTANTGSYISTGATYTEKIANGAANDSIATHAFKVVCNNTTGYEVKALAGDLEDGSNKIAFEAASTYDDSAAATTEQGKWTAEVLSPDASTFNAIATGTAARVKKNTGATSTAGDTFSVKYKAFVGTKTPAGTYQGTVTYTLYTPAGV